MRPVPASALAPEALVDLWNRAYEGYAVPMTWTTAQLDRHVLTGDVDLDRSIVWLDDASLSSAQQLCLEELRTRFEESRLRINKGVLALELLESLGG